MGSMALEKEQQVPTNVGSKFDGASGYLQHFRLYETRSNFYMIGRDKSRTCWKVLKINKLEQSELNVIEDTTTYSEIECNDLLRRTHEGNKCTGGLKFVTTCYGIVGFIKFLGPYYMLLITKRRKIGTICGHEVYSIAKIEMIPILNSTLHSNMANSKNENRYKKLLHIMNLTKDFFFSYSYHIMLSLQKNLSNYETELNLYETMFVWNEFLTRGIRNKLKNSDWTVALVYGFFKQVKLSISGHCFNYTLIARRSRHYAGTRYLKRGVNEKGRVANVVETEQIVLEDALEGSPIQISSVVQNPGFHTPLLVTGDIKKDDKYEATILHFANLVKRYGNPIIVLNLIKTREKKPRESILRAEFAKAIELINSDLAKESRLKFLHWDLSRYSGNKATGVLSYLVKVAANALDLTGFFYCQVPPSSSQLLCSNHCYRDFADEDLCNVTEDAFHLNTKDSSNDEYVKGSPFTKPTMFQKGVLRTNCIDCLDRTNVAQYVYGLVALSHQLYALGYIGIPNISPRSALGVDLMSIYEAMGDTLAFQYGGSAAHNKIFSEIRGQGKATTQSQELLRTLQRYYSNAYMDAEKQDAINLFLGHFQPHQAKPALWELDSDQHYDVRSRGSGLVEENARSIIKRSLSDGNILCDENTPIMDTKAIQTDNYHRTLPIIIRDCNVGPSDSTPEFSTCESDKSYSRYTPSMTRTRLFPDSQPEQYLEKDSIHSFECGDSSNFLDVEWLSSSGNSCEEEIYERSLLTGYPSADMSSGDIKLEASSSYQSGSRVMVPPQVARMICQDSLKDSCTGSMETCSSIEANEPDSCSLLCLFLTDESIRRMWMISLTTDFKAKIFSCRSYILMICDPSLKLYISKTNLKQG